MSTQEIFNYRKVNDQLTTAGQPTEEQLISASEEGFTTVINLAVNDPAPIADEAGLVGSLGMAYHHIPVEWDHPTMEDFQVFENTLQKIGEAKTLIHCAANFRVSAFFALYAQKHLGWSEAQAEEFRMSVWRGSDYPVWEKFIQDARDRMLSQKR